MISLLNIPFKLTYNPWPITPFYTGHEIYHFDIDTKEVHEKEFKSMPNCSAAFRYTGHYYCLHGHDFSKFDPNTGEVHGKYPKEAREYFMSCPHYGK